MQKNLITVCLLAALSFIFSACQPHRIDIQQGNKVSPENFEKLKTGLSRKQVLFLLGTPLLQDPFHQDRWDYIYYIKPGNEPVKQSRVTLYFKGDTLVKIDADDYAPEIHDNRHGEDYIEDKSPAPAMGGGGHGH